MLKLDFGENQWEWRAECEWEVGGGGGIGRVSSRNPDTNTSSLSERAH